MSRKRDANTNGQRQPLVRRYGVAAALAAIGAVLLWRAFQGGGPLFYFLSAVFLGMAYAAATGANKR